MAEQKKLKVHRWSYDDGSAGYAIQCRTAKDKKTWVEFDCRTDKRKIKQMVSSLKDKYGSETIICKKYNIPGGLFYMHPSDFPKRDSNRTADGLAAMNDLIHSCPAVPQSKKIFLDLISGVLAGYCAKECGGYYELDHIQEKYARVPVISVRYADYAYPILEKIVRSLAVDTAFFSPDAYRFAHSPL